MDFFGSCLFSKLIISPKHEEQSLPFQHLARGYELFFGESLFQPGAHFHILPGTTTYSPYYLLWYLKALHFFFCSKHILLIGYKRRIQSSKCFMPHPLNFFFCWKLFPSSLVSNGSAIDSEFRYLHRFFFSFFLLRLAQICLPIQEKAIPFWPKLYYCSSSSVLAFLFSHFLSLCASFACPSFPSWKRISVPFSRGHNLPCFPRS